MTTPKRRIARNETLRGTLRVAALTGGVNVPSARFRIRQYQPALKHGGITLDEFPAWLGSYPPSRAIIRPAWMAASVLQRLPAVLRSHYYDVTIFQRELISTLPTIERLGGSPSVLDVDDAIWVYRHGIAARTLARNADVVVCGNAYLAERFAQWNTMLRIIPTAVDVRRFVPAQYRQRCGPLIGWSGVSSGHAFLLGIEPALDRVLRKHSDCRLRVVSDKRPRFARIPAEKVDYVRWSPQNEVKAIQQMDIGIMPLDDSEWSKGKCAYKMLLYMACQLPVVVTPVGANAEILWQGNVGFGARSLEQWADALDVLLDDAELRSEMGRNGRYIVEQCYSVDEIAQRWASLLWSLT